MWLLSPIRRRLLPPTPLIITLLLLAIHITSALHADEAGINNFVLKSAGHGEIGINFEQLVTVDGGTEQVWITSQSNAYPSAITDGGGELSSAEAMVGGRISSSTNDDYCAIAARNVTSGDVIWRVNACASTSTSSVTTAMEQTSSSSNSRHKFIPRHTTLVSSSSSSSSVTTSLDNTGVLRKWNVNNGALLIDVDIFHSIDPPTNEYKLGFPDENGVPRLLDAEKVIGTTVIKMSDNNQKSDDESLVLFDTKSSTPIMAEGYHHDTSSSLLSAKSLLAKAKLSSPNKKNSMARIIDMHMLDHDHERISIWVGWSETKDGKVVVGSLNNMAIVEVQLSSKPISEGNTVLVYQIIKSTPITTTTDATTKSNAAASTPMILSSLRMALHDFSKGPQASVSVMGIATGNTQVIVSNIDVSSAKSKIGSIVEIDVLHPYWRSIASIHVDKYNNDKIVRVAGIDDRYPIVPRHMESMFVLNHEAKNSNGLFTRIYGNDEEVHQDTLVYCNHMGMAVAAEKDDDTGYSIATTFSIDSEDLRQVDRRVKWTDGALEEGSDDVIVPSSRGGSEKIPGLVRNGHLVECSKQSMTVVFTALGGMTVAYQFKPSASSTSKSNMKQLWSSEEALGSISSAIFLDETHGIAQSNGDADDEEKNALRNLRFGNRIKSQLMSFQNFIFGGGVLSSLASLALLSDEKKAERDAAFGFAKISVMLSERLHRVVALDTARNGRVVWSMNLHPKASWHKIVHGGQFVTLNGPHGNGGVHDHEMLALSYLEKDSSNNSVVESKCFDGTSGRIFSSDAVSLSSSISQVVPLRSSSHHIHHEAKSCRQVTLLILSDHTVTVVPNTPRSYAIVDEAIAASTNGLFVHTLDKETGEFHAFRVSREANAEEMEQPQFEQTVKLVTVGTTIFDPSNEKIVNVVYPRRGEVIQSPSTVLGDDALLLKYLNPHLMVVVTEATGSFLSDLAVSDGSDSNKSGDAFYNALAGGQYSGSSGQKRKPLGASKPGGDASASSTNYATPSLFITLVDTISGQILYRASHSHRAVESDIVEGAASSKVPVVISENWIVYSFFNQRTRRTDVGVLTLHEGMIDKNGITAFSAPEQELSFSSLESAKPIILSKTYGLAKTVTALGVTATKAGISSKQFLFATSNDQVISIDRRILDPRRPNGELKESEKMEGLMRYSPLLPIMPMKTPSHVYEVSSVESIASTSVNVESQSLVIAYGGPDIFFTRLAPSKGFDLLPDDFNRGLLTIVVVGLIVVLNVLQRRNKQKGASLIWA